MHVKKSHLGTYQTGMTLLEVVIAMLIIGLGLAMSLSMIQKSVRSSQNAQNHNTARVLMQELADKMRANSRVAVCYTNQNHPKCKGAGKTRAIADKSDWDENITYYWGSDGKGSVVQKNPKVYEIKIEWQDHSLKSGATSGTATSGTATANTAQQASMTFRL